MYKDHETPRFWITYGEGITKYINKNVCDSDAAQDIVQEVYLKIFTYCKRFDFCCDKAGVTNLRSWVFQVCHNAIVDHRKSKSKYIYATDAIDTNTCGEAIPSEVPNPTKVLNCLPPLYAEAVYYDAVLQIKQDEIATRLNISLSAAKSRIQRGKRMLRDHYLEALKK